MKTQRTSELLDRFPGDGLGEAESHWEKTCTWLCIISPTYGRNSNVETMEGRVSAHEHQMPCPVSDSPCLICRTMKASMCPMKAWGGMTRLVQRVGMKRLQKWQMVRMIDFSSGSWHSTPKAKWGPCISPGNCKNSEIRPSISRTCSQGSFPSTTKSYVSLASPGCLTPRRHLEKMKGEETWEVAFT